jgi:hypothetical protein
MRQDQARRDQAIALAQVSARYEARVDDLMGSIPKELNLTKSERDSLRDSLSQRLGKDPSVKQRVESGNFADLAPTFKGIVEAWSTDRKSAAETQKAAREKSKLSAFSELSSGPNPLMQDIPQNFADSWDETEAAFAKALERS